MRSKNQGTVAGIDVGGSKKGYHLCLMNAEDGSVETMIHARNADVLLQSLQAILIHRGRPLLCVAVDGPAHPVRFEKEVRRPERELARRGYRILYTPDQVPPSDHWMQESAKIHAAIRRHFPDSILLETYPSAIQDSLFGMDTVLPLAFLQERRKRKFSQDYLDALLCAATARMHLEQNTEVLENSDADSTKHVSLALPTFPLTRATLTFLLDGDRVLLGLKKKGFGAGYWNGFGGKIESGETVKQAAAREVLEECGMTTAKLQPAGKLYFHFEDDPRRIEGFLFRCSEFSGEPRETDEMRPQWYAISELPLHQMWEDDRFWLPHVLSGNDVYASFRFDEEKKMRDYSLEIVPENAK
ncbi:MAG: DUF429 domain-containing protein [Leptospiraceae bacterium]|nr:DUF429 domain-containing protein [Leptospiraceae bacterium]